MVTVRPPAFDWDARIRWAPGLTMFVRDVYGTGIGRLHATAFGLVTVVDQHGTPEMAQGELMRYLAEAVWYPTALLPSQGVRCDPIDDARARASLTDSDTNVSLEFRFDQEGLVTSIWAPARYRDGNGARCLPPGKRDWARVHGRQACGFRCKARSSGNCPEGPCRTGAAASRRSPMSWHDRGGWLGREGSRRA